MVKSESSSPRPSERRSEGEAEDLNTTPPYYIGGAHQGYQIRGLTVSNRSIETIYGF